MSNFKIWVGVLADYNAGRLHGQWYDLDDHPDAEDLESAVRKDLLVTSAHPNVEIECPFCGGDGVDPNQNDSTCTRCHGDGVVQAAEEWGILDHEGFPDGWVGEYTSFDTLYEILEHLDEAENEFGIDGVGIVEAFHHCFGTDYTTPISKIRDAYRGQYDSGAAYSEELALETGGFDPDNEYSRYIDWGRVWDCRDSHYVSEHDGHYFLSDW